MAVCSRSGGGRCMPALSRLSRHSLQVPGNRRGRTPGPPCPAGRGVGQGPGVLPGRQARMPWRGPPTAGRDRDVLGAGASVSALPHLPEHARHTRAGHRPPARPALGAPACLATLGVSWRICARPSPSLRLSTTLVGWDRSRSFCHNISAPWAHMTRPSPPPSAPLCSPRLSGRSSCTRWRTSVSAKSTVSRATIVGPATASGRPWPPSRGCSATSASVRFSCLPCIPVPASLCAMPS